MRNYRKSLMLGCVIGASLAFGSASYADIFTFSGMAGATNKTPRPLSPPGLALST